MLSSNKKLRESFADPVKMTYVQRDILKSKPQFFEWYKMIYKYMADNKASGSVNIEIGSGSSFLSDFIPGLIKTNLLHIKFNDLTCNAYNMPFKNSTVDNIILIDVLHHFDKPIEFFKEAQRILKVKARILICDPYISFLSYFLWRFIHPENCDTGRLGYEAKSNNNPLICANSASLSLLLKRKGAYLKECLPRFRLLKKDYHTIMHYWLAGGYNFSSFIPERVVPFIKKLEVKLSPLGFLLASFAFAVIEKEG